MTYTAHDLEQAWGLTGVMLVNRTIAAAAGVDAQGLAKLNDRLRRADAAGTLAVPRLPDAEAYQVREWLLKNGIEHASVNALLEAGISDPLQQKLALSRWEYATRIPREHPLTLGIAEGLHLTPEQMDAAWEDLLTY